MIQPAREQRAGDDLRMLGSMRTLFPRECSDPREQRPRRQSPRAREEARQSAERKIEKTGQEARGKNRRVA